MSRVFKGLCYLVLSMPGLAWAVVPNIVTEIKAVEAERKAVEDSYPREPRPLPKL